jgi:hypothetical protein
MTATNIGPRRPNDARHTPLLQGSSRGPIRGERDGQVSRAPRLRTYETTGSHHLTEIAVTTFVPRRAHECLAAASCGQAALALRASSDAERRSASEPSKQHADITLGSSQAVLDSARRGGSLRPLQRAGPRRFRSRTPAPATNATSITQRLLSRSTATPTRSKSPLPRMPTRRGRGVVATGAVGSRQVGGLRLFRSSSWRALGLRCRTVLRRNIRAAAFGRKSREEVLRGSSFLNEETVGVQSVGPGAGFP